MRRVRTRDVVRLDEALYLHENECRMLENRERDLVPWSGGTADRESERQYFIGQGRAFESVAPVSPTVHFCGVGASSHDNSEAEAIPHVTR